MSAFPCCGKDSVNTVERKSDQQQQQHHSHEEKEENEETELETELPRTEPPPNMNPDPGPVPQLEEMESGLPPTPTPETEGDSHTESPEQQNYRIESLKPYEEEPTTWGFNVNSTNKEEQECGQFRSIPVQTSKHLFWSNKLIQASEHSLQKALEKQQESPREKKSISISQVYTECTQRPSSPPVSHSTTPTAIGLADLINFASSLAVASSSNMTLPNLENMIKGTSEKSQNTSLDFCQPLQSIKFAQATQITQIASEKQDESPENRTQETRNVACSYLDINQAGLKTASIQGEVKLVQTSAGQVQEAKEEQQRPEDQENFINTEKQPRNILTRDAFEEQVGRVQKGRTQLQTGQPQPSQSEVGAATTTKEETALRSREFKNPSEATHPYWSGPDDRSQSSTDDSLLPLTPRQLAAFQDIFKLFSCSPTGTVDMQSMKVALRNVGIQLGPQEMCEALRLADLDGDGIVSFKDFLGVLTDNNRLVQCMGQMKGSRVGEPRGLQTLFLEVLFKLLSQGFVPTKSRQEVTSYYFKKQRALRLSSCSRNRARGQGRPARAHTGLTFFCQAARLNGLSSTLLARSLHTLCRAGGRNPYTQIPYLAGRPRPERKTRAPGPDVRLPKPQQPGRPKLPPNLGPLSKGPLRPPAGLMSQPLEQMRPSKLASSPPTLVQKHPSSPSPACFQRCAMKSLYK